MKLIIITSWLIIEIQAVISEILPVMIFGHLIQVVVVLVL
jgi:hypothetical protein